MREGLYGVILGNVYGNFKKFSHFVKESDCIVGPMCEFEFHSYEDIPEGVWIKIQVPHIVKNPKIEDNIRVISRDRYQECIEYAQSLEQGEEPFDNQNIYYRFGDRYIEIFTHHFSQFIVFAENVTLNEVLHKDAMECCGRSAEMLVFTKWVTKKSNHPLLEVTLYLCSMYYEKEDYRRVCMINYMSNENMTSQG